MSNTLEINKQIKRSNNDTRRKDKGVMRAKKKKKSVEIIEKMRENSKLFWEMNITKELD